MQATEGILLRSTPYMNRKQILTVFTIETGLVSLITSPPNIPAPFCIGEWVYKKGRKDLHFLRDMTLLNPLMELRQEEASLFTAGRIAQALLRWAGPPDPKLYQLCKAYFLQIHRFTDPEALLASFRLKLLQHEGLLALNRTCSQCLEPTRALAFGECFCQSHMPPASIPLALEELELFFALSQIGRFSQLQGISIPEEHLKKIELEFSRHL